MIRCLFRTMPEKVGLCPEFAGMLHVYWRWTDIPDIWREYSILFTGAGQTSQIYGENTTNTVQGSFSLHVATNN